MEPKGGPLPSSDRKTNTSSTEKPLNLYENELKKKADRETGLAPPPTTTLMVPPSPSARTSHTTATSAATPPIVNRFRKRTPQYMLTSLPYNQNTPLGRIRLACAKFYLSPAYSTFNMLVIMTNAAFLGTYTRVPRPEFAGWVQVVERAQSGFSAFFIGDFLLQLISRGQRIYDDSWGYFETVVCLLSVLAYFPHVGDFTGIRVLLLLKHVGRVPGFRLMPLILTSLSDALPLLRDVGILACYFLIIFGIAGTNAWSGQLSRRCVLNGTEESSNPVIYPGQEDQTCGPGFQCFEGYACTDLGVNPNSGTLSAWLTIMQSLSGEGWSTNMYLTMDATGSFAFIYYVLVLIFGLQVLIASVITIISNALEKNVRDWKSYHEQVLERKKLKHEQRAESTRHSSEVFIEDMADEEESDEEDQAMVAEMEIFAAHTLTRDSDERFGDLRRGPGEIGKLGDEEVGMGAVVGGGFGEGIPDDIGIDVDGRRSGVDVPSCWSYYRKFQRGLLRITTHPYFENIMMIITVSNAIILAMTHKDLSATWNDFLDVTNIVFATLFAIEMAVKLLALGFRRYIRDMWNIFDGVLTILGLLDVFYFSFGDTGNETNSTGIIALRGLRAFRILRLSRASKQITRLASV
ncbi:Sodium channel protein type 4 subunit alpha, partial [Quaeritorhiza haematococci]